ncbi:hypothetical protein H3C70_04725 [Patescibacteria group bacterium]|nr:hypothetical protein [Patescibacteria group bacterium]
MTTTVAAISVSLRSTVVSQAKSLATKYTQEGVEYFRTQRNLMGWESFLQELQESSIFCLAQLPYTETGGLEELPQRACTSGEFVDEKDRFQRVAHVTYNETEGQQIITITVEVTWQDSGRPLKSNAAIELRNNFLAQYDPPVFIPSPLPPSPVPTPSPSPLPSPSPSPLPPLFPSGAVIALNAASCPTGWSEFTAGRGRAIIGTNPTAGGGISVRTLGQTGGEETHTLTINEIPAHDHPAATGSQFVQVIFSGGGGSIYSLGANLGSWSLPVSPTTGSTGGGQAHNNMPPFIALLYCQKD